jgi:hypothetical protein
MLYRQVRVISTGQWVDVLFSFAKADPQNVKPLSHLASIANALGRPINELAVVDSDRDLRAGALLPIPLAAHDPPLIDPDLAAFDAGTPAEKLDVLRRRVLGG